MLQKILRLFRAEKPAVLAKPEQLQARDNAIQIGSINGDVYLTKKEAPPDKKDVNEAIKLHMELPDKERLAVVKWLRKEFKTGMIKELNRADLGLAIRYIRKVHKQVCTQRY